MTNNEKNKVKQLVDLYGNYKFEANEWGSCQYSQALATYKTVLALLQKYDNDLEYVLSLFGITYHFPDKPLNMKADTLEVLRDIQRDNIEFGWDDLVEQIQQLINKIETEGLPNLDEVFQLLRKQSWDLWSAILGCSWIPIILTFPPQGPENEPIEYIIQEQEHTGILAALMVFFQVIENPQAAFSRFST